ELPGLLVEQPQVLPGDAGHFGGHRRIDEHLGMLQPPLARELVDLVDDLLGATDGERRYHHVAAAFVQGPFDDGDQGVLNPGQVRMQAVAIGGFEHQQVGFRYRHRIAHDRPARLSQVATEHHFDRASLVGDPGFDDRGTDDVAGVAEAAAHGTVRDQVAVVVHGLDLRQAGRDVARGVDGLRFLDLPTPGCAPGVAFLDMGAVGQHHPEQVGGGGGRVDGAAETVADELGQQAAVVDVCVGQQDEVDRCRVERETGVVASGGVGTALEHAAVDQETGRRRFHQETGAGDLARPAEESYFHDPPHPPPSALYKATSCTAAAAWACATAACASCH